MSKPKLADLIDEYNEIKGAINYKLDDKKLFDKSMTKISFCEKTVGKSFFSLVRSEEFEIIFTHRHQNKEQQSRLELNSFEPIGDTTIFLSWSPDHCEICWNTTPGCCFNF